MNKKRRGVSLRLKTGAGSRTSQRSSTLVFEEGMLSRVLGYVENLLSTGHPCSSGTLRASHSGGRPPSMIAPVAHTGSSQNVSGTMTHALPDTPVADSQVKRIPLTNNPYERLQLWGTAAAIHKYQSYCDHAISPDREIQHLAQFLACRGETIDET
jgi:hypothetical protein